MKSRATVVGLFLALSATVLRGRDPQAGQQPTFRAATDLVTVDVSVRSSGQSVGGLQAADFVLLDNGVRQRIESVETAAIPLDVTLVTDVSAGTAGAWTDHASAAHTESLVRQNAAEIAAMLRPDDRLRLFAVDTYTSQVFAMRPAGQAAEMRPLQTMGLSSTYDGLVAAMLYRVEPGRRHLIVAWTKPLDNISTIDAAALRDIARQSDAVVHVVVRDVAPPVDSLNGATARTWRPYMRNDVALLRDVAEATGGVYQGLNPLGDISAAKAFKDIFDAFRQGYVLRYAPQGVNREGWHAIDVKVPRLPSSELRARRGYAGVRPVPVILLRPTESHETPALRSFVEAFQRDRQTVLLPDLRRVPDLRKTIRDYRDSGNSWGQSRADDAVFVLELAGAGLINRDSTARDDALELLNRQHDLVRHPLGADVFECGWYGAEAALLEGAMQAGPAVEATTHALERCPSDSTLLLARAVASDQVRSTEIGRASASREVRAEVNGPAVVIERYADAMKAPETAAEAGVRAAWLAFRTGQPGDALSRLDGADAYPASPVVKYFSRFMRGQILHRQGQDDRAARAYRDALLVWPTAQSARVGLMAILVARGEKQEAEDLAEAIQAAPDDQVDPWWLYWQGDFRAFDTIVTHLRELGP